MGLWDKIKGGYNWLDRQAGGHLPGGTIPGISTPQVGDTIGDKQYGGSYSPDLWGSGPTGGGPNPSMPFGNVPGASGGRPTFTPANPLLATGDNGTEPTSRLGRAGRWATDNPELVLGIAGLGANIYGAHKAGQADDERLAQEKLDMEQNWAINNRKLDQTQHAMDTEEQTAAEERARRARAYRAILAARAGGGAPPVQGG